MRCRWRPHEPSRLVARTEDRRERTSQSDGDGSRPSCPSPGRSRLDRRRWRRRAASPTRSGSRRPTSCGSTGVRTSVCAARRFSARACPSEIGYPMVVAYGGRMGADYLVLKRVAGKPLAQCWPTMSKTERRTAISQLAQKMKRLHRTPGPADLPRDRRAADAAGRDALAGHVAPGRPRPGPLAAPRRPRPHRRRRADGLRADAGDRAVRQQVPRPRRPDLREHPLGRRGDHGDPRLRVVPHLTGRRRSRRLPAHVLSPPPPRRRRAASTAPGPRTTPTSRGGSARTIPSSSTCPRQFDRLRLYAIAYDIRDLDDVPAAGAGEPAQRAPLAEPATACRRREQSSRPSRHRRRHSTWTTLRV